MSECPRGHRVVDSTGECVSLMTLAPGVFLSFNGSCEGVTAVLEAEARERRLRELLREAGELLRSSRGFDWPLKANDLAGEIAEVLR